MYYLHCSFMVYMFGWRNFERKEKEGYFLFQINILYFNHF